MVDDARLQVLADRESPQSADRVVYWMQAAQRAEENPALEYAIAEANHRDLPLSVYFVLTDQYPDANARHYRFMLEGLQETREQIGRIGASFSIRVGSPPEVVLRASDSAAIVVTDCGYNRVEREWRNEVADASDCPVHQIEGEVAVPLHLVSDRQEYAARTIRPKIERHLDRFLGQPPEAGRVERSAREERSDVDLDDINQTMKRIDVDRSCPPVGHVFRGGTALANELLVRFLRARLRQYEETRNQPQTDNVSHLSPYLHFGQISPIRVARAIRESEAGESTDRKSFLDELIVRRELARNYVFHCPDYDNWNGLPGWAQETLEDHRDDERSSTWTISELAEGRTDDPYWNAAMREMRYTGYMHNHMRMYWGKRIIEMTNTPRYAYKVALTLNNRYFLDGRDPNSFANVGWLFGLHDRGWPERSVFGKVRSMTPGGLKRKTDPEAYVEKVRRLEDEAREAGMLFEKEERF